MQARFQLMMRWITTAQPVWESQPCLSWRGVPGGQTPAPLERSWWVSSTQQQPHKVQPQPRCTSCSRFSCTLQPWKVTWQTWLLSQVRARSREKNFLQMPCEMTHANPASALLRGGQGTGEGNACCLGSDQGTGNSLLWHLATLLLSFSIPPQHYPPGGFPLAIHQSAGMRVLGPAMRARPSHAELPLEQRSCDTTPGIGWRQEGSPYLKAENTNPAWRFHHSEQGFPPDLVTFGCQG